MAILLFIKPLTRLIINKNSKNNGRNVDPGQSAAVHIHRDLGKFDADQSAIRLARTLKNGNANKAKLRQQG
jgi:hypothetical protein